MAFRRLAVVLGVLLIAGCSGGQRGEPSIAVGAGAGATSALLAQLYAAALRSYGTPAHVEHSPDPVGDLDTGDVVVVPGFTGQLLHRFDPGAVAHADEQVYRAMISALPEGVAAGDYTQSAEDKPALAVTDRTAQAWGGRDVATAMGKCATLKVGSVVGSASPAALGPCRPTVREFPDLATLFKSLRVGEVNAAWTSTAVPGVPDDVVVLADRTSLIRAENVVPLYRRNELNERQVLALNEIAGELDTGSLADMLRKVASGTEPGAVAADWLAAHPLGH